MTEYNREDRDYYDMQWRRSSSIIAVSSLIGIIVCLIICGICEFVWKFILYIK